MTDHKLILDQRHDRGEYSSHAHVEKPERPEKKQEVQGLAFYLGMAFHGFNLTQRCGTLQDGVTSMIN
jgi:hypothetical protein